MSTLPDWVAGKHASSCSIPSIHSPVCSTLNHTNILSAPTEILELIQRRLLQAFHLFNTSLLQNTMPVAKGRKRSLASATSNASSKRRKSSAKDSAIAFTRDRSPSKNVHFPSNLISGPYVSDPYRRSQSPVRSSLREKEDAHDTPDSQLELELEQRQAQCELSPVRKTAKLKGKSPAKPERGRSNRKADDAMLLDQLSDDEPSSPYYNAENGGFVYDRAKRKQEVADTEDESIHVTQTISLTPSNMDHEYVCTQMDELRAKVKAFAETFPANRTSDALYSLLKWDHKQLVRYIGCLALGGKEGIEGWRSLLSDKTCRHALVCGIVGRCLKEHVFDELCFGADQKLTDILSKKEHEQAGNDGECARDSPRAGL